MELLARLQSKDPLAAEEADRRYRRARAALSGLLVGYWILAVAAVLAIHHNRALVAAFALGAAFCEVPVTWLLLRQVHKTLQSRVPAGMPGAANSDG